MTPMNQQVENTDTLDNDTDSEEDVVEHERPLLSGGQESPKDRLHAIFLIFYFFGMCTVLPWNFFITANDYFNFKLRNVSMDGHPTPAHYKTDLQATYENYLSVSAQFPNALFMFLSATHFTHMFSLKARVLGPLLVQIIIFAITAALTRINSDQWQEQFFIITIISVIIINAMSAILQGGTLGMAAILPHRYMTAVMSGQGLGGTFAAISSIASLAFLPNRSADSAFLYFLSAELIMLVVCVGYFALRKSKFFSHYLNLSRQGHSNENHIGSGESKTRRKRPPVLMLMKTMWLHAFVVFYTFFITLSLFPAVVSLIQSMKKGSNNVWTDKYFTPVVCFLLFNLGDWAGRATSGWLQVPRGKCLLLLSLLRTVFIPLFMLCNVHPRHNLPVVFDSDIWPVVLVLLFALSNGFTCTLAMIFAPKLVEHRFAETAGTLMGFCLVLGLLCGAFFSFVLVKLL